MGNEVITVRIVSRQDPVLLEISSGRIPWQTLKDGEPRVFDLDPRLDFDGLSTRAQHMQRSAYRQAVAYGMKAVTAFNRERRQLSVQFVLLEDQPGPTLIRPHKSAAALNEAEMKAKRRRVRAAIAAGEPVDECRICTKRFPAVELDDGLCEKCETKMEETE